MSAQGPNKDVRALVQPLLDAIAPESITNQLELASNSNIQPQGWQNNFFETKIRQTLDLDVLVLNGAWDDDVSKAQKLEDILGFISNPANPQPSEFAKTMQALLEQAQGYINELHVSVQVQLDDPFKLNYDPLKTLAAFCRMVNVVLSVNAIALLETFDQNDLAQLNEAFKAKQEPACTKASLTNELNDFISQQVTFSISDRIKFRILKACHVSFDNTVFNKADNGVYYGGSRFDKAANSAQQGIDALNTYPASYQQASQGFVSITQNIVVSSFLYPFVKAQQLAHYLHKAAGFPLRAVQAGAHDIPFVGNLISRIAGNLAPYMGLGVGCCALKGLLDQDLQTQLQALNALPPVAKYVVIGALSLASWQLASQGLSATKAAARAVSSGTALGKDMVKAVVEENMAAFNTMLEKHPKVDLLILNEPIEIPQEVMAVLSLEDQDQIFTQIAQARWICCKPYFPTLATPHIMVAKNPYKPNKAAQLYLPSRAPKADGMQEVCEALAHLSVNDDANARPTY
ncbi:MAG: hypothetical protein AB7V32_09560 [Candidatus Berkiella sp.]